MSLYMCCDLQVKTSVATLILSWLLYFYQQALIFILFKSDGDGDHHNSIFDNILSSNLESCNITISTDHACKNFWFLL